MERRHGSDKHAVFVLFDDDSIVQYFGHNRVIIPYDIPYDEALE